MHYEITSQPSKAGKAYTLTQIINMWAVGDLTQNDTVATAHKQTEAEIELMGVLSEAFTPEQYTAQELIDLCERKVESKPQAPKLAQVTSGHLTIPKFRPIEKHELYAIRNHSRYAALRWASNLIGVIGVITLLGLGLFSPGTLILVPIGFVSIAGFCTALDVFADIADLLHHIYRGLEEA